MNPVNELKIPPQPPCQEPNFEKDSGLAALCQAAFKRSPSPEPLERCVRVKRETDLASNLQEKILHQGATTYGQMTIRHLMLHIESGTSGNSLQEIYQYLGFYLSQISWQELQEILQLLRSLATQENIPALPKDLFSRIILKVCEMNLRETFIDAQILLHLQLGRYGGRFVSQEALDHFYSHFLPHLNCSSSLFMSHTFATLGLLALRGNFPNLSSDSTLILSRMLVSLSNQSLEYDPALLTVEGVGNLAWKGRLPELTSEAQAARLGLVDKLKKMRQADRRLPRSIPLGAAREIRFAEWCRLEKMGFINIETLAKCVKILRQYPEFHSIDWEQKLAARIQPYFQGRSCFSETSQMVIGLEALAKLGLCKQLWIDIEKPMLKLFISLGVYPLLAHGGLQFLQTLSQYGLMPNLLAQIKQSLTRIRLDKNPGLLSWHLDLLALLSIYQPEPLFLENANTVLESFAGENQPTPQLLLLSSMRKFASQNPNAWRIQNCLGAFDRLTSVWAMEHEPDEHVTHLLSRRMQMAGDSWEEILQIFDLIVSLHRKKLLMPLELESYRRLCLGLDQIEPESEEELLSYFIALDSLAALSLLPPLKREIHEPKLLLLEGMKNPLGSPNFEIFLQSMDNLILGGVFPPEAQKIVSKLKKKLAATQGHLKPMTLHLREMGRPAIHRS